MIVKGFLEAALVVAGLRTTPSGNFIISLS